MHVKNGATMHEMGLAEGIIATVGELAAERPVERVVVRVGAAHGVVAESLTFGFGLLAAGTACDGATLVIDGVAGDELLVDEVVLRGSPPVVLRRPGLGVGEGGSPHAHAGDGAP